MKRPPLTPFSTLVAALVLAGCIDQSSFDATTAAGASSPDTYRTQNSSDKPSAEPREDTPSDIAAVPDEVIDTAAAPQTAPDLPGVEHLVGLPPGGVESLLGAPNFRRRDPPAEVWRYAADSCRLFVFLYARPDDASDYRVSHIEVLGANAVIDPDDFCFHSMLRERHGES